MNKIQVYHFHNGKVGGVLSVIRNLLQYSANPLIENHIIYTINKEQAPFFSIQHFEGATTEKVFYYSPQWNFYYTCTQLSVFIPNEQAIIVAHDWLELGMVSQLGLQNRVINFVHGDYSYYYQLAKLHEPSINSFIAITNSIAIKLNVVLPERKADIYYLRFPVPSFTYPKKEVYNNNIVFNGRLSEDKGYHLLPVVDSLLRKKNIQLNWHIVGDNKSNNNCKVDWPDASSVKFYGQIDNEAVLSLLQNMDYFILPSSAEGMPVSLIEAMKAGVVPIVNDMEGGIQELVNDGITGFKIRNNVPAFYADCIEGLIQNNSLCSNIRNNSIAISSELFDPYKNTKLIEAEIYTTFLKPLESKKAKRVYGSLLDQKWLLNILTKSIRNFK